MSDMLERRSEGLTLLVIEREGSSGTDAVTGEPTHALDVQVAMYPGANPGVVRRGQPSIGPEAVYSSEEFMDIVAAAWQQDDMMSTGPVPVEADRTEQNVLEADGRIGGTVYVVRAGLERTPEGGPRIVPGSVGKEDPSAVPASVMEAQEQACAQAVKAAEAKPDRLAQLDAMAAEATADRGITGIDKDGPTR